MPFCITSFTYSYHYFSHSPKYPSCPNFPIHPVISPPSIAVPLCTLTDLSHLFLKFQSYFFSPSNIFPFLFVLNSSEQVPIAKVTSTPLILYKIIHALLHPSSFLPVIILDSVNSGLCYVMPTTIEEYNYATHF